MDLMTMPPTKTINHSLHLFKYNTSRLSQCDPNLSVKYCISLLTIQYEAKNTTKTQV